MPRHMALPDTVPKVLDQPVPLKGLVNPRPLDIRLLGTLSDNNKDIDDIKHPEITIRQPEKTMWKDSWLMYHWYNEL